MSFLIKLIISIAVAAVVSTLYSSFQQNGTELMPLSFQLDGFIAFTLCALLTIIILGATNSGGASNSSYDDQDSDREQGEVKWFNVNKGFGFITRDEGGDIFVHFRAIRGEGRRALKDGERVEFDVVDSDKGLQAEDVCPC
jgi:CspA family cold shock protein